MQALVTGANGFVGRRLVRHLSELGWGVAILVPSAASGPTPQGVEVCRGDVRSPPVNLPHADVVFHLAAVANRHEGERDPLMTMDTNVGGTLAMAQHARRDGARFVLASSSQVYGAARGRLKEDGLVDPVSTYGASKLAAEWIVRGMFRDPAGPGGISLRFFNVYGPGQTREFVIPQLLSAFQSGETPQLRTGRPVRDFVFVDDVVAALVLAGVTRGTSPVLNVGSGIGTSIADLAELARSVVGARQPALVNQGPVEGELSDMIADVERTRAELGWAPKVRLEEGLKLTANALAHVRS